MSKSVNMFRNKLVHKGTNNILANPAFYYFASFLIAWLIYFFSKPDSSKDLTTVMILLISSLEIINPVPPDQSIFLWIAASVVAAAVNPNGIKTLFVNGLSTFPIKGNPFFSHGPKILPKNPPYCPILCNSVFHNFILADEPFAKALRSFEVLVLVNNNLCGKFFS